MDSSNLPTCQQEMSWLNIVGSKRGTVRGPAVLRPAAGMTDETVSPCVSRMIQNLWTLSLAWPKPIESIQRTGSQQYIAMVIFETAPSFVWITGLSWLLEILLAFLLFRLQTVNLFNELS